MASKGLGPLPRRSGGALALGCGRSGRGALPLARAAGVSTRLRVRQEVGEGGHAHGADERLQREDGVPLSREQQLRHQHLRPWRDTLGSANPSPNPNPNPNPYQEPNLPNRLLT